MNINKAYEMIELAKNPMLREFGVAIAQDHPLFLRYIPYEEISSLSLGIINQEVFATELRLREENNELIVIKEGLDTLIETIKKISTDKVSNRQNFSKNRGILECMSCDYSCSAEEESIFHTHQCSYNYKLENINNETFNKFTDSTDSYFFSWQDIVFARQGGVLFLQLDFKKLSKIKTEEELEQEKRDIAKRMKESEVKGFYIKVDKEQQCCTSSIAEWLDFLLTKRGWFKPIARPIVEDYTIKTE